MDIATIIQLFPALAPYALYLAAAVGVAAQIATLLVPPAPGASSAYKVLYAVINWIGRNVRCAANANAPTKTGG